MKENELRVFAKMEMGSTRLPNILAQLYAGISGGRTKGQIEPRKGSDSQEAQIDGSKPVSTE